MAVMFSFLLVKFILLVSTSYAIITCSDPPHSAQLFFDLDALKAAQGNYSEIFQAPRQCVPGGHSCEDQVCCAGEVGCCYRDPKTKKGHCGCKSIEDSVCSPAPLAYIHGSTCKPNSSEGIGMCVKMGENGSGRSISNFEDKCPINDDNKEDGTECGGVDISLLGLNIRGSICRCRSVEGKQFLKKFTAEMLLEELEPHIVAQMVRLAEEDKINVLGSLT